MEFPYPHKTLLNYRNYIIENFWYFPNTTLEIQIIWLTRDFNYLTNFFSFLFFFSTCEMRFVCGGTYAFYFFFCKFSDKICYLTRDFYSHKFQKYCFRD